MTRSPLLGYYVGAYGPTIRIDTQTLEELKAVKNLFRQLASGEVVTADFGEALACRLDSIQSLVVTSMPERSAKALELKEHGSRGPTFSWTNTTEDWQECAEKVNGLIQKASPGHQYLTREGLDDALVELCYKE